MATISVQDYIEYLDHLKSEDFKAGAVDNFLMTHSVDLDSFHPYIIFREGAYGRNLVKKTSAYELLVLTWLPGQSTPIHDHNEQLSWVLVHTGVLSYCPYQSGATEHASLSSGPVQKFGSGEVMALHEDAGFHLFCNAETKPAVSIHLYAAPLEKCRLYSQATQQIEWAQLEEVNQVEETLIEASPDLQ